jgi:hypothetical protein
MIMVTTYLTYHVKMELKTICPRIGKFLPGRVVTVAEIGEKPVRQKYFLPWQKGQKYLLAPCTVTASIK